MSHDAVCWSGLDREGRGPPLPELRGAAAKEVGLWLGEVHLLQDGDMLGHQATQMGAKRKRLYNSSIYIYLYIYISRAEETPVEAASVW